MAVMAHYRANSDIGHSSLETTRIYVQPSADDLLGSAVYGERFGCAAERGNVFGVQFHPEKSSAAGLRLLANFAGVCASVPA